MPQRCRCCRQPPPRDPHSEERVIDVPFIDIKRYEEGFLDALNARFATLVASAQFVGGAEVARLEQRLAQRAGVGHAVSCANGTDALQLALRALGVGRGDTVLVPDLTFWATFEAVVNVGADPVTVDADLADGGVAYGAFEEAIARVRPKAAILAHLYGWGSGRLAELRALCEREGVRLVEDGAQCFGTTYRARPVYAGALISTTSFYPAKVLGGAGDGGAVFTDDTVLADKVRRLGNHGRTAHYGYSDVGWNSRLDTLQAAFLNLALEYLEGRIASRRQYALRYRERLTALGIKTLGPPADYVENGYTNVCLVHDPAAKATLESALKAAGIGFGNIYPGALSRQEGARGVSKGHFGGRGAETLCASVVNLPLFAYMRDDEFERVLAVVRTALA